MPVMPRLTLSNIFGRALGVSAMLLAKHAVYLLLILKIGAGRISCSPSWPYIFLYL